MKVEMFSHVTIEVVNDADIKYALAIPFGSAYEDAYKALDMFKASIDQMQENAKKVAEAQAEAQEKDIDVKIEE